MLIFMVLIGVILKETPFYKLLKVLIVNVIITMLSIFQPQLILLVQFFSEFSCYSEWNITFIAYNIMCLTFE